MPRLKTAARLSVEAEGVSRDQHLAIRYRMIKFDAQPPDLRRWLRITNSVPGAHRLAALNPRNDRDAEAKWARIADEFVG